VTEKREVSEIVRDIDAQTRAAAKSMAELARTVLMAGVGVAGLAMDEAKAFVDKLVERGELAEKDAKKLMDDFAERSKEHTKGPRQTINHQIEEALQQMNLPTHDELADLRQRIGALSAQIDALLAARQEPPEA